ncbi:hypothetical protein CSUI_009539, partial [Cystoisospora suis]
RSCEPHGLSVWRYRQRGLKSTSVWNLTGSTASRTLGFHSVSDFPAVARLFSPAGRGLLSDHSDCSRQIPALLDSPSRASQLPTNLRVSSDEAAYCCQRTCAFHRMKQLTVPCTLTCGIRLFFGSG